LRLVVSIAKRCLVPGMELEELVQEGTVGLIHAIDRFDPSLGYRLSTYATWWIRQMILRHLQTYSRLVRLPAHVTAKIHEVREATERLAQELSRIPSIRELAQTLEMKESKVSALIRSSQAPLYLNDHGPEEDRPSPGDTAAAPGDPDPYELAEAVALRQELYRALRKLPERERRVIVLRFGLPPADRSHNLEEIGKTLGVSAERARQLERQGLKRLRQIAGHSLRAYLMAD
jgi:RNA polymerase primary sigma factor